jgi:hypothetical protein
MFPSTDLFFIGTRLLIFSVFSSSLLHLLSGLLKGLMVLALSYTFVVGNFGRRGSLLTKQTNSGKRG